MQNHPLSTLMLCSDPESADVSMTAFSERGIAARVAPGSQNAIDQMGKEKFDAMVLDLDSPGAWDVLRFQCRNAEHQPGIVIAIAGNPRSLAEAQKLRVHFVLRKPFTSRLMARTLGAAHHLLLKEKQIPFRKAVRIPASGSYIIETEEHKLDSAVVIDISHGGLCLQTIRPLPSDATVILDFRLPESGEPMHMTGKIRWTEARGKAGVQFQSLPQAESENLRRWLGTRSPWSRDMTPPTSNQAQAAR